MATEQALINAMEQWVPDDVDLPDVSLRRKAAVTSALRRFGKDVPRRISELVSDNPQATADLTGDWDNEFSEVLAVEWPYLTATAGILVKSLQTFPDGSPAVTIDVETDGTYALRFPGVAISAGAQAKVTWTVQWTAATLPSVWDEAVVVLACALLCDQLAGLYSGTAMPEPGGAVILDAGDKAGQYREQAKTLMATYESLAMLEPRNPITLRRAGEEEAAK